MYIKKLKISNLRFVLVSMMFVSSISYGANDTEKSLEESSKQEISTNTEDLVKSNISDATKNENIIVEEKDNKEIVMVNKTDSIVENKSGDDLNTKINEDKNIDNNKNENSDLNSNENNTSEYLKNDNDVENDVQNDKVDEFSESDNFEEKVQSSENKFKSEVDTNQISNEKDNQIEPTENNNINEQINENVINSTNHNDPLSIDENTNITEQNKIISYVTIFNSVVKELLTEINLLYLLVIMNFLLFIILSNFKRDINKKYKDVSCKFQELSQKSVELLIQESTNLLSIYNKSSIDNIDVSNISDQHDIVKIVADRLSFMKVTLSKMDPKVKGYKQLNKSISQIIDNLKATGYEIIDYLGQEYNEGLKVSATFISDDSLNEGQKIVTGVIKPQINYKGEMIQSAQITVSQN